MIIERIKTLLELCSSGEARFPPTDLYNEGWMLRLVLDWLHRNRGDDHRLCIPFPRNADWYSEALLPSAFFARHKGDRLAESRTHADGVIGHFKIGQSGKGDLSLRSDATSFVVIEAKMFSKLSSGVTNAPYFNQAARNVACIAKVVGDAEIQPEKMDVLGFFVVAPEEQIALRIFKKQMARESIKETVKKRVDGYGGKRDGWHRDQFLPVMEEIEIATLSWERIIGEISGVDAGFGHALRDFYRTCLKHNRPAGASSSHGVTPDI